MNPKLNSTISVIKNSDTMIEFFKTNTRQQLHIRVSDDTILDIVLGLDGSKSIRQISEEYDVKYESVVSLIEYLRKNGIIDKDEFQLEQNHSNFK